MKQRAARTRTLVQLGSLIEVSGLNQILGIELGCDLQKDADTFNPAATLLGILLDAKKALQDYDGSSQRMLWQDRGKVFLMKRKLSKKA